MSFKFVKQLPSPEEIKEMSPVTEEMKKVKETRDRLIQDVITGNSDKFLVIVGPCSADNEEAVCDYTNRLAKVQEKVADRLVLVPRIYTNKPRTTGEGYKGIFRSCEGNSGICGTEYLAGKLQSKFIRMYYEERSQESVI